MTNDEDRRVLRARWVFPVACAPICDGTVTIEGERIAAHQSRDASPRRTAGGNVADLGNVAILPGLVNAHTHLEFSDLTLGKGTVPFSSDFVDWIRRVIEFRRRTGGAGRRPIELGLQQSARLGTTTLGEIAQPGWSVEPFEQANLSVTVFLELIAPTAARVAPAVHTARQHLQCATASVEAVARDPPLAWQPGLSPHAPFSVHPELLLRVVAMSAAGRAPIAMHLAESREELELLRSGSGPLRDLLEELGAWDSTAIPTNTRPLHYLRTLADAHRALIVHGNYLDDEEIAWLAEHASRMTVVYCPRSHAYFGHDVYPLEKMLAAGVAVALGTDGRSSSPDLSVLAEMRLAALRHPQVGRDAVLRMGTICGARALGRDREVGSLEPGKYADLAIVALPDCYSGDPYHLLFNSDLPVVATWRRGRVIAHAPWPK